jgi:hypothetical protein
LSARNRLRASNSQNTMGYLQVLGRSVRESVHPISIRPTRQSYFEPQIRIKIRMGRRIVLVSLLQIHQIEGNYNLIKNS